MFIKVENDPTVVIRLSVKEVVYLTEALKHVNRSRVHEDVENFLDIFYTELNHHN